MSSYSKVARDPLICAIGYNENVPGYKERLLVAWDEEKRGKIREKKSHVSTNKGRTSKINWNTVTN